MAKLAGAMQQAEEELFRQFTFLSELQLGVEGIDARIRDLREEIAHVEAAAAAAEAEASAAREVPILYRESIVSPPPRSPSREPCVKVPVDCH